MRGRAEVVTPATGRGGTGWGWADLTALLVLVVATGLLYGGSAGLWWTGDDFAHLRYAGGHGPPEYFFDPATWGKLPWGFFTPLLTFSYDLDLTLFGYDPLPFHLHHLAALAAAAAALFALFRLWWSPGVSLFGALLFLLGRPLPALAQPIDVRHYLEGLALAAAATALFVLAVRRRRGGSLAVAAAVCYLAAMSAKEIYVPLAGLLVFLPEGTLETRLRRAVPVAAALVIYLTWRWWMLGALLGGYGPVVGAGDLPEIALNLPREIAAGLFGGGPAGLVLLAAAVASLPLALRGRRAALFALVAVFGATLPLAAVARSFEPRYLLGPWVLVVPLIVWGGGRFAAAAAGTPRRAAALLALLVVLAAALAANRPVWADRKSWARQVGEEGRFLVSMEAGDRLARPLARSHYLRGAAWFREEVLGGGPAGGWYEDGLLPCAGPPPAGRLWRWDADHRAVADATGAIRAEAASYCAAIEWERQLEARFEQREGVVSWELGPWKEGRYALVLFDGVERFEVPRRGRQRFPLRRGAVAVRVRYEHPEGWVTYSPPLEIRFGGPSVREWERPAGG